MKSGMKKVMVIGCPGAGKTTFSRRLQKITGIELFHLDQYYWQPNWQPSSSSNWRPFVQELADREEWIIDGNYGGTLDLRIAKADMIIYLDYPTLLCLWRVTKRIVKFEGQSRPDMPIACPERFDLEFYKYIANFNTKQRATILDKLKKVESAKDIFIFKKDIQVDRFLNELEYERETYIPIFSVVGIPADHRTP